MFKNEAENESFSTFWNRVICLNFSEPMHPEDAAAYATTQVLSAHLHAAGIDGLLYSSAMNPNGHNCVIFAKNNVEIMSTRLCRVESVSHEVEWKADSNVMKSSGD
ncbi:RES family NAD+ phosphorylase [Rubripirellula lacrimiformis]|uniref:RES family NAD+ phosphorylase n=1 Tax=Rubripirellula lacrimiformis TaxID=1930273 RepID=UPI001C54DDE6|nr:RES family NAD+ phosphorylase [Rubripirellula lacrimiformis]